MGFLSDLFGGKKKSDTQQTTDLTTTEDLSRNVSEQRSALEAQLGITSEQLDQFVQEFSQMTSEQQQQMLSQMSEQERQLVSEVQRGREVSTQKVEKDVSAFQNIPVSSSDELRLHLDRAVALDELEPEQARAILQQRTELEGLQPDPAVEQVQMQALAQLQSLAATGEDAISKQALAKLYDNQVQEARASRERVKESFAERGQSGSGTELAAQLAAEDQAQRQRSEQAFNTQAQADQRRRDAITQAAAQAATLREQKFGEQAKVAESQDRINAFNTTNLMQTELANLEQRARTGELNQDEKRRVQELNISLGREEAQAGVEAAKTQFEQQMEVAKGKSGAYSGQGTTTNITETEQNRQQQADTTTQQQQQQQTQTQEQQQQANQQQTQGTTTGTQVGVGMTEETGQQNLEQSSTGTEKGTSHTSGTTRDASQGLKNIGSLVGMVGGLLSDRRQKTDIQVADDNALDRFLDEVTAYKYRYKPGVGSPGEKVGPMAQDLERTEAGSAVHEGPNGKVVDTGELTMALTAMFERLGERVRRLEEQR